MSRKRQLQEPEPEVLEPEPEQEETRRDKRWKRGALSDPAVRAAAFAALRNVYLEKPQHVSFPGAGLPELGFFIRWLL